MKKFLVIGNPIDHSLSPKLHNYWINKNKLKAVYGKLETFENDLFELTRNLKEGKLDGLNVTVPFKNKIIPHIDILSGHALKTKSVNTISVDKGNLIGNTNPEKAYNFFLSKEGGSFTPAQAAGIVGNLMQESGKNINPTIVSGFKDEGSFGIAQWNPSKAAGFRLQELKRFCKDS